MSTLINDLGFFVLTLFAFSVGADPIKDNWNESNLAVWYTNVYNNKLLSCPET